jgi:glycosyltransferase involved in cell wall biosynthesis
MNILYTNFHQRNGGGHASYVANLAQSLSPDHRIVVATPDSSRLFKQVSGLPGVRCVDMRYSTRLFGMIPQLLRFRKLLKSEPFHIIHTNGSVDHRYAMLARIGLARRPAIIWTKHNTVPIKSFGQTLRARIGTDGAIGVCNHVAALLRDSCYRSRPIEMVRLGIDIEHFHVSSAVERARARRELLGDLPDDALVLGSVGGTDRDKGWLVLVQAVSRLEPAQRTRIRLVVAGDPPSPASREAVARLDMSDTVVFPGLVSDVRPLLAACDIGFVLSFHEAGSYATCETMASGLPALVSDAGGVPELVRHGLDGWVVRAGDADGLVPLLGEILQGRYDLAALGAAARDQAVRMFSMPDFARRTCDFYRRVSNET